jgi:hypothetical protein
MPTADFTTALTRVDRAVAHREELWAAALVHKTEHPLAQRFQTIDSEVCAVISATSPFPVEVAVIFGEWLYNLRAALDALIYELAVDNTDQDPPPNADVLQYPICDTPEKFEKTANRKRGYLCDLFVWARTGIEHTQPHYIPTGSKGHALWWLSELAKLDRHRRHHLLAWRVSAIEVRASGDKFIEEGFRICDRQWSFISGTAPLELVALRRRSGSGTLSTHDLDVAYTIQPDLPDWVDDAVPGFGRDCRLDQRMVTIEDVVRSIIEQFHDRILDQEPWSEPQNSQDTGRE